MNKKAAKTLWKTFIAHLNKVAPLPDGHKNFLGSIQKYEAIFLAGVATKEPDKDEVIAKLRAENEILTSKANQSSKINELFDNGYGADIMTAAMVSNDATSFWEEVNSAHSSLNKNA